MKTPLFGKSIKEIEAELSALKENIHNALSLSKYLYKLNISNFNEITSIPKSLTKALESKYTIGKYPPTLIDVSTLDNTYKYLFKNQKDQKFEAVYMPGEKRNTLCISTQSGCRMGCDFCLTGKISFKGNLSALDIINQLYSIPEWQKINRLVIMGMGEPFDNFDEVRKAVTILTSQWGLALGASSITISTVGLKDPLFRFLQNPFCNLAISIHSPFNDERIKLMPIERSNPIKEVVDLLRNNPIKKPLRLSFEYVALGGINTTEKHAVAIGNLLKGLKYHLNIIPWNEHKGSNYNSPDELELKTFISCLNSSGVLTTVRESRGIEIGAACGQMAGGNIF